MDTFIQPKKNLTRSNLYSNHNVTKNMYNINENSLNTELASYGDFNLK